MGDELHQFGELCVVSQELVAARVERPLRRLGDDEQNVHAFGGELIDDPIGWERVPLVVGALELAPFELETDPAKTGVLNGADDLTVVVCATVIATRGNVPAIGEGARRLG